MRAGIKVDCGTEGIRTLDSGDFVGLRYTVQLNSVKARRWHQIEYGAGI
jgi:hypothetical protein